MAWEHPPQMIQWDITSRCNLKCKHCRAAGLHEETNDLDFQEVTSILANIHRLNPYIALAMVGGEPLMRQDLRDIFSYIRNHFLGMSIELLTNGTLINERNIDWLLELVNGFNISLEGASPRVSDAIRGQGAFERTVKGIKLLVERRAKVTVRMTHFHQDEGEAEKLMRFLSLLGVNYFNFRYLVPVGRAQGQRTDAEQYKQLCQRIWDLGKELDMEIGFSDPFPEILVNREAAQAIERDAALLSGEAVTGCSVAFSLLYLDPQGFIKLCPYFPVFIADAKEADLWEVWFKNEFLNIFRTHRSKLEGRCGQCQYKFACGGCRGAAWANGNFLGEDPRCWKDL